MIIPYLDICNNVPESLIKSDSTNIVKQWRKIIIMEMMDGELIRMTDKGIFKLSDGTSALGPGNNTMKRIFTRLAPYLKDIEIIGVNQTIVRKIRYMKLPSHFMVIAVAKKGYKYMSWQSTKFICNLFGLHTLPILQATNVSGKQRSHIREDFLYYTNIMSRLDSRDPGDLDKKIPIDSMLIRNEASFQYNSFENNIFRFSISKKDGKNPQITDDNWTQADIVSSVLDDISTLV